MALTGLDKTKLMALMQSKDDDDDDLMGAPAAAVYESKSGSIVDVLADMKERTRPTASSMS